MADVNLDCKSLCYPMPIVRISKTIKSMEPGEILLVEAADLAFRADIEAGIAQTGLWSS